MKCIVFSGPWNQTQDSFNNWAKGKALTKDVIIHSHAYVMYKPNTDYSVYITIVVFYPETQWDKAPDKWQQAAKEKTVKPTGTYEKAIAQ